jgi:tRNA-specific 2-thiouridylase
VVVTDDPAKLYSTTFEVAGINWFLPMEADSVIECATRIRQAHHEAASRVEVLSGQRAKVTFDQPQMSITPGQAAVFYDGEIVLGSGIIA